MTQCYQDDCDFVKKKKKRKKRNCRFVNLLNEKQQTLSIDNSQEREEKKKDERTRRRFFFFFSLYRLNFFSLFFPLSLFFDVVVFLQNIIDAYRCGTIVILVVSFNQVSLSLFLNTHTTRDESLAFLSLFIWHTVLAKEIFNLSYREKQQQRSIGLLLLFFSLSLFLSIPLVTAVYLSLPFIDFWRLSLVCAQEACCCAKPCFRSTSSLQLNTDIPNSVGTLCFFPYRFLPPFILSFSRLFHPFVLQWLVRIDLIFS